MISGNNEANEIVLENLNLATVGHVDSGKTTVTSTLTGTPYDKIDKSPEEKERGITIDAYQTSYKTAKRQYSHMDAPGHREYIKNMITCAAQIDAVLLVVDVTMGLQPQTREHIMLAYHLGSRQIIVVLNKCDLIEIGDKSSPEIKIDQEQVDLVKADILDLLARVGFDTAKVKFVCYSAYRACVAMGLGYNSPEDRTPEAIKANQKWLAPVKQLLNEMDNTFVVPKRDIDSDPLLMIDETYTISGRGTVVTGVVSRGVFKTNDAVQVMGEGKVIDTVITDIESFKHKYSVGAAGNNMAFCLRSVKKSDISGNFALVKPNTYKQYSEFRAQVYLFDDSEGGRNKAFKVGYKPQAYLKVFNVTAEVVAIHGAEIAKPGENVDLTLKLTSPVVLYNNLNFALREGGKTIGQGRIIELIA